MLGGTHLLTKLLLPALENAAAAEAAETLTPTTAVAPSSGDAAGVASDAGSAGRSGVRGAGARVINVSSAGMYTVSGKGISKDLESRRVDPWDATVV